MSIKSQSNVVHAEQLLLRGVSLQSAIVDVILPERSVSTQQPRWWEQLPIHRKEEEYVDGQDEVRHLWKTQIIDNRFLGIFFAPYFFCMIFIGFPMLYLHLCIGQYAGQTADVAFRRLMPVTCG
ncbi:hypothetical protein ANCDUO_18714 [Ancylostoma duodenale]|uniref:Uncharacterized protein n=1 Tax=Ancylostoma duodenale TaxID=51022 RepID=A0A0C2C4I1_9BILA|nr:hypothetical protein ANCDUO_18714 [Ancylostoma duodenale]